MPNSLHKIIGLSLIIFTISEASQPKNKLSNSDLAKRSLVEREKEFLKTQPLSEDLLAFIEKYKSKNRKKREKNLQNIEDDMYIIQNGQLMPFKSMQDYVGQSPVQTENRRSDLGGFTVVPLVIPLVSKPQQEYRLLKPRNLNEELQNNPAAAPPLPPSAASTQTPPPSLPPPPPGASPPASTSLGPPEVAANATINVTTPSSEDSLDDENRNDNATKEETAILHKILEDVQGLMQRQHEGSRKEGVLCNLNGSWISDAAGMRFDICYQNSTRKKFRIHVADRIPPNEDGFLCDGNWTVFGELPFQHSGMVIALAVHAKDKHIATFIGECRVCEGSETVTGTWLLGRSSRDCKDQKAAHKVLADVWKREHAHTLRKKHLQQIGITDVDADGQK